MEQFSQQKTLEMQRGLFLIRYESSESANDPPRVGIAPEHGSENAIELILPPDMDEAVLWSPGASLVVRATRKSTLRVTVTPTQRNASIAARVQVVSLSNDPSGVKEREQGGRELDLSQFRILGHVSGRGDVVVDADDWIGGPLAPSRIEGIAIQWPDKPHDLTLRYAVTVGGPRPVRGRFLETGAFAGTRGRALPVVGAILEIEGAASMGQQLVVESIFLGSPKTKIVGRRVVLAGPTGREPLVGFRVGFEPGEQRKLSADVNQTGPGGSDDQTKIRRSAKRSASLAVAEQEGMPKPPASTTAQSPLKRSGRVRVFRSSARGRQA